MVRRSSLLALAALCLVLPASGLALGLLVPEKEIRLAPAEDVVVWSRPLPPAQQVPLKIGRQTVTVDVTEQVSTTKVDQTLVNETNRVLEGTFLFPLPDGAMTSNMALYINGKRQEAEMLEAQKARGIYEGIVRRMEDPALLEYMGNNLFKCRVYPIPARGERRLDLSYDQVLDLDGGVCRYTFPLKAPQNFQMSLGKVSIEMRIRSKKALKAIYSPSHEIDVVRKGDHEAVVSFEADDVKADRDFVLIYTVSEKDFACNLLCHRPDDDEDGWFLLLLNPAEEADEGQVIPKDVTFVVDTSGSMAGEKILQARRALEYCVKTLGERDRFNIITFSTSTRSFEDGPVPATEKNRKKAMRFIEKRVIARGGTNIDEALQTALKHRPDEGRPHLIVFATDGEPTVGETNPDRIVKNVAEANTAKVRIHGFGIGTEINTKLLSRLGSDTGGATVYVAPKEDMELKISSFVDKIASPVMTDLELDFGKIRTDSVHPRNLPDLFKGSQIRIFGRYENAGKLALRLRGKVGKKQVEFFYDASFPAETEDNDFLPRLWAQRHVAYLQEEIRLHGEKAELKEEIVRLATLYNIPTVYTSMLVVEDGAMRPGPRPGPRPRPGTPVFDPRRDGDRPSWFTSRAKTLGGAAADEELSDRFAGAPAAAPAVSAERAMKESSGKMAFEMARSLNKMKKAEVLAQSADDEVTRSVGPRTFHLRDGVWTDTAHRPELPRLEIRYGSAAYFALFRALPKLKACLALGKKVIVVHKGKALVVLEGDGRESMDVDGIRAFFGK